MWSTTEIAAFDTVDVMSDGTVICSVANQIKSSIDDGANWSDIGALPATFAGLLRTFVDSRDYIFASGFSSDAGDCGLYRSIDSGANFTKVLSTLPDCGVWGIDEDANGNLYAGEYSRNSAGSMKIWKSTDGGANWTQKYSYTGGTYDERHIHDLRVSPTTGYIYCPTGDEKTTHIRLLRSKDAGETWDIIYEGKMQFVPIVFLNGYVYGGSDGGYLYNEQGAYRFLDNGDATVTPEIVGACLAGYDSYFLTGSGNTTDLLFGQVDGAFGATNQKHILYAYNGYNWLPLLELPAAVRGFVNISRHNHDGNFYVASDSGVSWRVKRTA